MTATALKNRHFLVTRPANQADRLANLLQEAGAEAIMAPMIVIGDSADPDTLDAALTRLDQYQLAVFVSPTALDEVARRIDHWPEGLPAAVIGPASAERAREIGIEQIISPAGRFDSEGLLAEEALQQMQGKRVLLFRGNGGRELLADTLSERGAEVDAVEAYRRLPPELKSEELAQLLSNGCDGVIVTSSEAVQNLFTLADEGLRNRLCDILFFASHPRIAEAARQQGVRKVTVTAAGDAGIVATLREMFASASATEPMQDRRDALSSAGAGEAMQQPARAFAAKPKLHKSRRVPKPLPWAIGGITASVLLAALIANWRIEVVREQTRHQLAVLTAEQQAQYNRAERAEGYAHQLEGRLALIEQQGSAARSRIESLEGLYGALAGDRDAILLADAELTIGLAAQQLQLTGDVGGALVALDRLDERLVGSKQLRLEALRRALARDIAALKALPAIDSAGLSVKLDSLANGVDRLPLKVDAKVAEEERQAVAQAQQQGWFMGLLRDVGSALGAMVEIRRLDDPNDPMLLAPEQAAYVREHVKLRLLNARLALLQRDQVTYRQDLAAAEAGIRKHFDKQAKPVQASLASLRDLLAARTTLELPSLADSLAAARDARRRVEQEEAQ